MACEILSCEGAVFVLWGKPTVADIQRVVDRVELIAEKSGRPIVYITRVPVDAPAPDATVRKALESVMPRLMQLCAHYSVVLEGEGFVSAVKRGILTGLLLLGWRRENFRVWAGSREIVPQIGPKLRLDAERILYLADSKGLLTCGAPDGPESARATPSRRPNQQLWR
jgi:hypothetical protein